MTLSANRLGDVGRSSTSVTIRVPQQRTLAVQILSPIPGALRSFENHERSFRGHRELATRSARPAFAYASAQMSGAPFDAYIRTSPHGRPPESGRPVLSKLYSTKISPFGLEKFVTTGVISPEVVSSVPKLEVKVRESLPTVT